MKQSGIRWTRSSGRKIVDLRTACRSKLWNRIWSRSLDGNFTLPETNSRIQENVTLEVVSKPGLAPVAQKQFQQILQLQGCLSRF
jgi:hypothetical protein